MERRHVFLLFDKTVSCAWTRKFHFSAHRQPRSEFITFGFNLPKPVFGADRMRQTRSRAWAQPRAAPFRKNQVLFRNCLFGR